MQICPECGTRNPAGAEFCSACNTFLAWDDQQPPPRTPAPVSRPEPGPGRDAIPSPPPPPPPRAEAPEPSLRRERTAVRHHSEKVHRLPPDPAELDDRTVALPRFPDVEPDPGGSHRWVDPPPPDGTDRVASSSKVQGPGSVPPSREPSAVPPADTQAPLPRPSVREPETSLAPGEVACPQCGTGNSPDRHFCRRCALELRGAVAEKPPPPPPPPRQGRSPVVWVLVVLVALVLLVWLVQRSEGSQEASGPGAPAIVAACWAVPGPDHAQFPAPRGQLGPEPIPRECSISR